MTGRPNRNPLGGEQHALCDSISAMIAGVVAMERLCHKRWPLLSVSQTLTMEVALLRSTHPTDLDFATSRTMSQINYCL